MALYIGVNYHPHDWSEERWKTDIKMMKEAGFTTVRVGHLCWDSFEPDEGVYTFEWFDKVMDMFDEAGIGIILDIPARPAPVWVHKLCPGCDIGGKSGNHSGAVRRYMDDVADEGYRYYLMRFAKKLVRRYKDHKALFGWGLCNEQGSGFYSLSESSRRRFAKWLKKKYKTVDALNSAWAAQRWCRKLTSFDDVVFPENESATGAPEPWLDMRRFFSDNTSEILLMLKDVVKTEAPGSLYSSNHYAEHTKVGFDYLGMCDELGGYPGMGFYPEYEINDMYFLMESIHTQRIAETGKPMWAIEYRSGNGSGSNISGPKGAIRCLGMLSLLKRTQMILGWTWRTMYAAEEKFLFGLLSHDGEPTPNFYEYKQLAEDIKKIEPYAFPYLPEPEIGVSYDYPSFWITSYHKDMFKRSYLDMQADVAKAFYYMNRDYNTVDLRNLKNKYKLIVVPNQNIMGHAEADTIRRYVKEGGIVIMTGTSAYMDENSKAFTVPRPGLLDDVFGIRIRGFYRTDDKWSFDETSAVTDDDGVRRERLTVTRNGSSAEIGARYYEVIGLNGAKSFAGFKGKELCAVSRNEFGNGVAYYTAAEADSSMLSWLIEEIADEAGLSETIDVPNGVQARKIADKQYFFVNYSNDPVLIKLPEGGKGVLSGREYGDELELPAYGAELIVSE